MATSNQPIVRVRVVREIMQMMQAYGIDEVEIDAARGERVRIRRGPPPPVVEKAKAKEEPKPPKKTLEQMISDDPDYERHSNGLPVNVR